MKELFTFLLFFSFSVTNVFAQKETFDLVTYTLPKGWKKEVAENAIGYTIVKNKSWCRIIIYKSTISKGSIEEDYKNEWQELVIKTYSPTEAPRENKMQEADGWKIKTGNAKFIFDNSDAVALLTTATGHDRCVSVVALTNNADYMKDIDALLASVTLIKPETNSVDKPVSPLQQNNKEINTQTAGSLTNYVWESHQSRKDALGNNAGYSTNRYQFYRNGTYKFSNTTFQYYTPKYYMVNEEGTYQVIGNKIIIKPAKNKFEVRQREKTDPVSKSGTLGLDIIEYSFEYATVYDRLRLVLVPGNKKETKRDGVFNYYVDGEITKSYLYDAE